MGLLSLAPGLLYADNGTAVGVETWTTENVWQYDPLILLVVYAIAALVDIVVIVIGVWAMARNGGASGFKGEHGTRCCCGGVRGHAGSGVGGDREV